MEIVALPAPVVPNEGASPMLDLARIRPVAARSWNIQSASAIAGDMRIKTCWLAFTCL